jgi:hypothetical protein
MLVQSNLAVINKNLLLRKCHRLGWHPKIPTLDDQKWSLLIFTPQVVERPVEYDPAVTVFILGLCPHEIMNQESGGVTAENIYSVVGYHIASTPFDHIEHDCPTAENLDQLFRVVFSNPDMSLSEGGM